jgi:hypothetical protein
VSTTSVIKPAWLIERIVRHFEIRVIQGVERFEAELHVLALLEAEFFIDARLSTPGLDLARMLRPALPYTKGRNPYLSAGHPTVTETHRGVATKAEGTYQG